MNKPNAAKRPRGPKLTREQRLLRAISVAVANGDDARCHAVVSQYFGLTVPHPPSVPPRAERTLRTIEVVLAREATYDVKAECHAIIERHFEPESPEDQDAVELLGISDRVVNRLGERDITTTAQLLEINPHRMESWNDVGRTAMREIVLALRDTERLAGQWLIYGTIEGFLLDEPEDDDEDQDDE